MIDNNSARDPADGEIGRRIADDTVRLERSYAAPIERVWHALTTPEGLAPWLGPATVELRPGGAFRTQLTDDVLLDGRIASFEAPRALTIVWREIEDGATTQHSTTENDESELSFALRSEGTGTRLVLTHRLIRPGEQLVNFGAGWHAFLTALQAALLGEGGIDVGSAYERLRPRYGQAFAAASPAAS